MTLLVGDYVPSTAKWVRDQVEAYVASGGAKANTLRGGTDPIVVITSVGRKSGALRKNPLMRVERGGKYLAVASIGGGPTNPEWYHNFLANPVVELQDGPEPKLYRARLLEGAEREDWWAYAVQTWSTYGKTCTPNGVSATLRVVRTNKRSPNSTSSWATPFESVG